MNDKTYVLGLDNGGTVTKGALFDLQGKEILVASRNIPLMEPKESWVERDLNMIWDANVEIIQEILTKSGVPAESVIGIGLTGYGNGICLVDSDGEPVYPAIVSSDSRASDLCERLREDGTERAVYPLTYQEFWEAQTAILMVWLKENNPSVLEQADCVLSIKDYIRMKLTGKRCYELTETTCNGLMNIHTNSFDPTIFKLLGLEEYQSLMPEYTGVMECSGTVTQEAATHTGLAEGTIVAGSCYDVDACALANGILDDDTLCMIAGTWSINEVLTRELVEGANSIARSFHPDYYIMEESSPTSANNFEWYVKNFIKAEHPDMSSSEIYAECNRLVSELPPEDSDVVFIPYLYASSTTPGAKGAFLNLKSNCQKAHMIRAIYEGIVFSACLHVKRLRESGKTFSKVRLAGGITKSEVWSQMVSDILQMPLEVSDASEPGALGAAICASIAAGVYPDIEDAVSQMVHMKKEYHPDKNKEIIYQQKYETYERALRALDIFYGGEGEL